MINIELNNYNDAFNKFNREELSEELASYIFEIAKQISLDEISITIKGEFDEEKQSELESLIRRYYRKKTVLFNRNDKYNNIFKMVFALIGLALINASIHVHDLLGELFLIAGSVAIWEVVADFLFEIMKRKRKKNIYTRLSRCNISFEE